MRILDNKVQADLLSATKSSLKIEMNQIPMTLTFETALKSYRNIVNEKHPASTTRITNVGQYRNRDRRFINQMDLHGRGFRGGRGRDGYGRGRG